MGVIIWTCYSFQGVLTFSVSRWSELFPCGSCGSHDLQRSGVPLVAWKSQSVFSNGSQLGNQSSGAWAPHLGSSKQASICANFLGFTLPERIHGHVMWCFSMALISNTRKSDKKNGELRNSTSLILHAYSSGRIQYLF